MVQHGSKITQNMKMAQIVQKNLGKIIWYSNTLEYFGRIYSFAKIFVDFSWANLFGDSFVIFQSCRIYLDIHSSNIYGNEYIWIFICPKIGYSSHTGTGRRYCKLRANLSGYSVRLACMNVTVLEQARWRHEQCCGINRKYFIDHNEWWHQRYEWIKNWKKTYNF